MSLPPFNTARGVAALTSAPPFDFDGVTARVFPLRAEPSHLRQVCDETLNIVPDDVAVFRPALPFVFLIVLNYGRMAELAANTGWVSQNEVGFCVPVQRYRREGDRLVYVDWAVYFPFIYVDQPSSLIEGRQVYGWRKQLAWLEPGMSPWTRNPTADEWLMTLSTQTSPFLFGRSTNTPQKLLEILCRPQLSLGRAVTEPWRTLRQNLESAWWMQQELWHVLRHLPIGSPRGTRRETENRLWTPGSDDVLEGRILTLRQFRDAEQTSLVAYQALIESVMKVRSIERGGLLGRLDTLAGNTSGGYRIHLHQWPSEPIVDVLGLKVQRWERSPRRAESRHMVTTGPPQNTTLELLAPDGNDARNVAVLEPVLPFWIEANLFYSGGKPLCWRGREGGWHEQREAGDASDTSASSTAEAGGNAYNVALGGLDYEVRGPYEFPHLSLRVLPLPADRERLQAFCRDYLDDGSFNAFEVSEGMVYLLVWNFQGVVSKGSSDMASWIRQQVDFAIPLAGGGEQDGDGLLAAYAFANGIREVTSFSEIYGLAMTYGEITSPGEGWLSTPQTNKLSNVLRLATNTLTSFDEDSAFGQHVVLEIAHDPGREARRDAEKPVWGGRLWEKLVGRLDAAPEAGDGDALSFVALKQFRASEAPEKAAYQAVVRTPWEIGKVFDVQRLAGGFDVRLHTFANLPIAESLGLLGGRREYGKSPHPGLVWQGVPVSIFEPVQPFRTTIALRTQPSQILRSRLRSNTWRFHPRSEDKGEDT